MIILDEELKVAFLDFNNEVKVHQFWQYFDCYIDELVDLSQPLDCEYFHSGEYRQAIMSIGKRQENPLYIILLLKEDKIVGFCSYCIYHNENGKAFLLEIGIDKNLRGNGLGKKFYRYVESDIKNKGGKFIELTPYPKERELFWQKLGYHNTHQKDEDQKYIFKLNL